MLKNDSSSFLLASDVLFCSLQGHRKPNHSFTISISFYICIYIYIHISIYIHLLIIDIATSISLSISIYIHWYTNIDPFIYYRYSRYIIVYVLCFLCALYLQKKSGARNLNKTPRVALVSNLIPLFHPRLFGPLMSWLCDDSKSGFWTRHKPQTRGGSLKYKYSNMV